MGPQEGEKNINDLIDRLITLGEDREELNFWQDFYDKMGKEHKEQLLLNLARELEALEKLRHG